MSKFLGERKNTDKIGLSNKHKKKIAQEKIQAGNLCYFNKKVAQILLPLNKIIHNIQYSTPNALTSKDVEYIYTQLCMLEKENKIGIARYTEKGNESIEKLMINFKENRHAYAFDKMFIADCKIYDNQKLQGLITSAKKRNQNRNKHKEQDYSKSEAIQYEEFRKQATKENVNVYCAIPQHGVFFVRIKNALKSKIELLQALESSPAEYNQDFIEPNKINDPYISVTVNMDGLDFRIVSLWTTISDNEQKNIGLKSIETSTGQTIENIQPIARMFPEGLVLHKLYDERHYAIVEFIEENETSQSPEQVSLGIIPTCLIKKH